MDKKNFVAKSKKLSRDIIIEKSLNGIKFSREELTYLFLYAESEWVYRLANEIRKKKKGNIIYFRGIIEFSNYCSKNCLYCGIRRDNRLLKRYRMEEEEILEVAKEIVNKGFRTIVLQSGEDPIWNTERLVGLVKELKKLGVSITLSVGERNRDEYRRLKKAGTDRFLLKHETINNALFSWLKPDTSLEKRLRCLNWLKEFGYEVGVGCIVGIPRQKLEQFIDELLFLQDFKPQMVGHGPFIPHPHTPLATFPSGSALLTLKMLALTRIVLSDANLPISTALSVLAPELRLKAFLAGANVFMPDLTPITYKRYYDLYPGKGEYQPDLENLLNRLQKVGLKTDLVES